MRWAVVTRAPAATRPRPTVGRPAIEKTERITILPARSSRPTSQLYVQAFGAGAGVRGEERERHRDTGEQGLVGAVRGSVEEDQADEDRRLREPVQGRVEEGPEGAHPVRLAGDGAVERVEEPAQEHHQTGDPGVAEAEQHGGARAPGVQPMTVSVSGRTRITESHLTSGRRSERSASFEASLKVGLPGSRWGMVTLRPPRPPMRP